MKNVSLKKLFVPMIYLTAVFAVLAAILLTIFGIDKYLGEKDQFNYSVNGIIDNSKPVNSSDTVNDSPSEVNTQIIKPYNSDSVTIGRYYYDFEADSKSQENSIIFYENTYMQNSGVDYISDQVFDILSVLDGKVISVLKDETLGNIVKIEHDKEIVSVYQGIDEVSVKEGDLVTQGNIIGKSGTSKVNSNFTTSLHFEVYYKGTLMDPESFYTLKLEDL